MLTMRFIMFLLDLFLLLILFLRALIFPYFGSIARGWAWHLYYLKDYQYDWLAVIANAERAWLPEARPL